jgi:hypothetical protein
MSDNFVKDHCRCGTSDRATGQGGPAEARPHDIFRFARAEIHTDFPSRALDGSATRKALRFDRT